MPSGMTGISAGDILNLQRENGMSSYDVPGSAEDWVRIDGNPGDGSGLDLTVEQTLTAAQKQAAAQNINDRPAQVDSETEALVSLGYRVLNPNLSFAEQVNSANTIYEIKDSFDLEGSIVNIPDNCQLKFNGGRIIDSSNDKTGRLNGLERIVITPKQVGCQGGNVLNTTNLSHFLKLQNVKYVVLDLDDDYCFSGGKGLVFKNLEIRGNAHTLYLGYNNIFDVDGDIICKDLVVTNYINPSRPFYLFNLTNTKGHSNVVIDNIKCIHNQNDTKGYVYGRVFTNNKVVNFIDNPYIAFNSGVSYVINDRVSYSLDPQDGTNSPAIQFYKFTTTHIGAWSYNDVVVLLPKRIVATDFDTNKTDYMPHNVVSYDDKIYMFIDKKTTTGWDSSKVVEVEYADIDYGTYTTLTIKNSFFENIIGPNAMIVGGNNCEYDNVYIYDNIVHNLCLNTFFEFGVTNKSIFTKLISPSSVFPRRFNIERNLVYNDLGWNPTQIDVSPSAITYYTPFLLEGGICVFKYNKILNLIVKSTSSVTINRVYSGYLSTNELIFEYNTIKNQIKVGDVVELIKCKAGAGIKAFRHNTFIEESLDSLNIGYDNDTYLAHFFGENYANELVIENNNFTIDKFYGQRWTGNRCKKITFCNNNINIRKIVSPYEFSDGNSVRRVVFGINCRNNVEYIFDNNTIIIDNADATIGESDTPTYLNTPVFIFDYALDTEGESFSPEQNYDYSDHVDNRRITNNTIRGGLAYQDIIYTTLSGNKSYPYFGDTPPQTKYFHNMVLFEAIYKCKMSEEFVDVPYRWNKTNHAVTDGLYSDNLDYYIKMSGVNYNTTYGVLITDHVFGGGSNNTLMTVKVTDENGKTAIMQKLKYENVTYCINKSGAIVETTVNGLGGVNATNLGDNILGGVTTSYAITISNRIIRLGMTDDCLGHVYRVQVTKERINTSDNMLMLPKYLTTYSPDALTDTKIKKTSGEKVFASNLKKNITYAGTTWVDNNGYTPARISGTANARPTLVSGGDQGYKYFDTTLSKPIFWDGTAWRDSNGDYIADNSGTLQNRLALASPVKGQQFKLTGGENDVYLIYGDYGWLNATDRSPWFDDNGTLNTMYDKYNYTLLTEEPSDWAIEYNTYYKKVNGIYTLLTTAETWAADTYYKKDVNAYKGIQVKLTDTDAELRNKIVKWDGTKYINIVDNVVLKAGTPIITFTTENNTTTAIMTSTSSGKICYTTDGSTPTSSSTEYSSAITLADGDQVKVICIRDHVDNSNIGFVPVSIPVITFNAEILHIECGTPDAKIYYTTDGSTPTTSSTEYDSSASVTIAKNVTVKAFAILIGRVNSEVASKKRL